MACQCRQAGFCSLLGKEQTEHLYQLCRSRDDYHELFCSQARKAGTYSPPTIVELPPCGHRGEIIGTITTPLGIDNLYRCNIHREVTEHHCNGCRERLIEPVKTKIEHYLPIVAKGPRIKTWAVGMVTAPRIEETFTQSMRSLIAAGWDSPRIFAEPESPIPDEMKHLPITQRTDKAGCWQNFYLGLQELFTREPDADAYMLAQDDVIFYPGDASENLRQYLERSLWPADDGAAVSIYCGALYHRKPGWHQLDGEWLWGACAFIWPRESLKSFLGTTAQQWSALKRERMVDVCMGRWHTQQGKKTWYCSPSLTQHIGDTSTIWGPDNKAVGRRAARLFMGNLIR